ncbi:zinc ribbon domain-containing protein [Candidatus Woesearchaeota archaeon]|nr:zinc ribbon domain-containing protein [Candidatus Woesearchaeota archaeon]
MPTYVYECKKCGETFEVVQKISDNKLANCLKEECGGVLERLICPTTFILKGDGWYKDGYSGKKA